MITTLDPRPKALWTNPELLEVPATVGHDLAYHFGQAGDLGNKYRFRSSP